MNAQELLEAQLKDIFGQVSAVYKDISESSMDHKSCPSAMTPREMLEHLCECCVAVSTHASGEKYSWGSYSAPDKTTKGLWNEYAGLRAKAVQDALGLGTDEGLNLASNYLVLHEPYHVGQVVTSRLESEPTWDADSMYA